MSSTFPAKDPEFELTFLSKTRVWECASEDCGWDFQSTRESVPLPRSAHSMIHSHNAVHLSPKGLQLNPGLRKALTRQQAVAPMAATECYRWYRTAVCCGASAAAFSCARIQM